MNAWHFVGTTLRDGRPVPADGEWLAHDGPLVMCASGLHASVHPFDALRYAPGAILCRVELGGEMMTEGDKTVARRRRILARRDLTVELRAFARQCALDVIHLWDAPPVVRRYLETGDETIRAAARAAAMDADWAAARDAAWVAARDAAGDAAKVAQRQRFRALVGCLFEEDQP